MPRVGETVRNRLSADLDHLTATLSPRVGRGSRAMGWLRALRKALPVAVQDDVLVRVLAEFARLWPKVAFIQIGANDGNKGDYLQDYVRSGDWWGVLVEPIPEVFASLADRYGTNPRLRLVNAAITDHDGQASLYYIPRQQGQELPDWYDALATFRKDVLLKHEEWIPDIDARIGTIDVQAMTFETFCNSYGVTQIDLIQIDTEGYDYEIIKQIDLNILLPAVVLYEHLHLDPKDRTECEKRFERAGYVLASNYMDTLAVRLNDEDRRSRRLAGLLEVLDDEGFALRRGHED